jgi:hypothetical protein
LSDSEQLVETDDLDLFTKQLFGEKEARAEEPSTDTDEDSSEDETDDEPVAEDPDTDEPEDEDEDDSPDGDEEPEPEPKAKKNRKTFQERIDELTRDKKEAERREQDTARRLADLEAKLTPKETKQEKAPEGAPDPNEEVDGEAKYPLGEFDPQYIRDLTRFTIKTEQEAAEAYRSQREKEAQNEAIRTQAQEAWSTKLTEAEEELPDIREKINSLEGMFTGLDAGYGQYLVDVVMSLDAGPKILHYLADNPKEARQIVSSGPAGATLALGRLDARLARTAKPEPVKKVSKAPEPPVKTPRGSGGKFAVPGDTDDLDAFTKTLFNGKRR